MQLLSDISYAEFTANLSRGQLQLRVGPYVYRIKSAIPLIAEGLHSLYLDYPLVPEDDFADYCISMDTLGFVSSLLGKAEFLLDGQRRFGLVPSKQAYAFLEWRMNWCVAATANEYLKLHAAVVAKDGCAIVMPGVPGAGKSTLCAALALSGWRVLSDEHALICPGTNHVIPICRPISLKNESIEVVQRFDRRAKFGPVSKGTHKGDVAHMKADLHPDSHNAGKLPVVAMVFPRYSSSETQMLSRAAKSRSFIMAAYHSFNYSVLGRQGFDAMVTLVDAVECYDLVYRDLDWGINTVQELLSQATTV